MHRFACSLVVLALFAGAAGDAAALRPHERDGWILGLSYGGARGEITLVDGSFGETEDGVSPQIRLGRMVGRHLAVGVSYAGWMYETGEWPIKDRFSMQNIGAAVTWYPGNPDRATGGLYVRGGLGLAWTTYTLVELEEGEEQHHGDRTKENGLGVEFNLGYEFRISDAFAAGLGVGFLHADIGGDIFEDSTFFPATLNLGWYF